MVVESATIDVNPADPVAAGKHVAAGIEGVRGAGFFRAERADSVVGGEAFLPSIGDRRRTFPLPLPTREGRKRRSKAPKQAGDVGRRSVDVDCAEIDEAGDFVAGEENVVLPDVAQAGLQPKVCIGERL